MAAAKKQRSDNSLSTTNITKLKNTPCEKRMQLVSDAIAIGINSNKACKMYGIPRSTYYTYKTRLLEHGTTETTTNPIISKVMKNHPKVTVTSQEMTPIEVHKHRRHSQEQFNQIQKAIANGLSMRKACRMYMVPRATYSCYINRTGPAQTAEHTASPQKESNLNKVTLHKPIVTKVQKRKPPSREQLVQIQNAIANGLSLNKSCKMYMVPKATYQGYVKRVEHYARTVALTTRPQKEKNRKQVGLQIAQSTKDASSRVLNMCKTCSLSGITICNHLRDPWQPCKLGRKPLLTSLEEDSIVSYLSDHAERGFAVDMKILCEKTQKLVQQEKTDFPFQDWLPGKSWKTLFLQRHPIVNKIKMETRTKTQLIATKPAILKWFNELKNYLNKTGHKDILNCPNRIFSASEFGFLLNDYPNNGVLLSKSSTLPSLLKECKNRMSVLCNFCAAGDVAPTMVMYKGKQLDRSIEESVPCDVFARKIEGDWMCDDTFIAYLHKFHTWLKDKGINSCVLLLVNGYDVPVTVDVDEFCLSHNIILYSFYRNTTYVLQPAEVGISTPLKITWQQDVQYSKTQQQDDLTCSSFATFLKNVMDKCLHPALIQNAFQMCGLYPFNPAAVDYKDLPEDDSVNIKLNVSPVVDEPCVTPGGSEVVGTAGTTNVSSHTTKQNNLNKQLNTFAIKDEPCVAPVGSDGDGTARTINAASHKTNQKNLNKKLNNSAVKDEPCVAPVGTEIVGIAETTNIASHKTQQKRSLRLSLQKSKVAIIGKCTALTEEKVQLVLDAINGGLTVSKACVKYGVARTTFTDYIQRTPTIIKSPVKRRLLLRKLEEIENKHAQSLVHKSEIPVSKNKALNEVKSTLKNQAKITLETKKMKQPTKTAPSKTKSTEKHCRVLVPKPQPTKANSSSRNTLHVAKQGGVTKCKPLNQKILQHVSKAVVNGSSIYSACKKYGISKSTFMTHNMKYLQANSKMGRRTIFNSDQEESIVCFVNDIADRGFPLKPEAVCLKAQQIVLSENIVTPFTDGCPGKTWLESFLCRHPELKQKRTESNSKMQSIVTMSALIDWFAELKNYLTKTGHETILNNPSCIFNADESGFHFNIKSEEGLLLAKANTKFMSAMEANNHMTVLCNFSAAGDIAPIMVVYKGQHVHKAIEESVPSGFFATKTEDGWMDGDTFVLYLHKFYAWLKDKDINTHVLLLIDSYNFPVTPAVHDFCTSHNIILYSLYPNANIVQPIDAGIYRPLRIMWKQSVQHNKEENQTDINCSTFSSFLKHVMDQCLHPEVIQRAFQKCGIYPFNPEAVDYEGLADNFSDEEDGASSSSEDELSSNSDALIGKRILEKTIPPTVLHEFNSAKNSRQNWSGDVAYSKLYVSWLTLSRWCSGEMTDGDVQVASGTNNSV